MEELKKGDIIAYKDIRHEVLARVEDIVFLRRVYEDGSVGDLEKPMLLETLIVYGNVKEDK